MMRAILSAMMGAVATVPSFRRRLSRSGLLRPCIDLLSDSLAKILSETRNLVHPENWQRLADKCSLNRRLRPMKLLDPASELVLDLSHSDGRSFQLIALAFHQ
jgi:hypothetical protein